jgi:hypothetical protein
MRPKAKASEYPIVPQQMRPKYLSKEKAGTMFWLFLFE